MKATEYDKAIYTDIDKNICGLNDIFERKN